MFKIKICGITRVEDALAAAEAGADAIGLNFYPGSKRYVEREAARAISAALGDQVLRIGVFVNATVDQMRSIAESANLSAIQLHGDESPDTTTQLAGIPVILARRMTAGGLQDVVQDVRNCAAAGRSPNALLVDAHVRGEYGGTGQRVASEDLADHHKLLEGVPLILAGGLTPANVASAIQVVRPAGVDTASGVESSPGVKDPEKVTEFVAAAMAAFSGTESTN